MSRLDLLVDVDVKGDSKLSSLGGALRNVAGLAAGAMAAVAGIGAFTSNFASDLNESLSKVNVVFGNNADVIKKWADDAALNMGLSEQAALEAAGTFGNLFDAMELPADASVDMSQTLVELASDLASFNNIETDEALVALRAGIVGEAEPLRRLGVNLSQARTEAKALELGIWDGIEPITAAQKAQANYALILEDTTNAQGDFARTAGGMANQQRTLGAVFADSMADIGQAFVPLIESMLPQITAGLQSFAGWVTTNMPTIQEVIGNILSGIGAGFSFLIDEVLPRVIEVFSWVAENVFPLFAQGLSTVGNDILPKISEAITFFVENVLPGLVAAFQAVVGWVTENLPLISSIFGQVFGAIDNVVKAVWPILEPIATFLFPIIGKAATELLLFIDRAFKGMGLAVEVFGNVAKVVWAAVETVWKAASGFFEGIWDAITGVFKTAETVMGRIGDKIWKPLADGFEAAIGVVKAIWNAFAGFWNSIQITMPQVDIPGVGKVGGFTIGLPDLPFLATGGIIDGPTLAMLGEKGPEAVIPLDKLGDFGTTVNVNVQGDLKADERTLPGQILRTLYVAGVGD